MQICEGFEPGEMGEVVSLHARHYARHWGFGPVFEGKVATEMAAFVARKADGDVVLVMRDALGVAASLTLDLHDPASGLRGAHVRWFIAADRARGTGVGRRMMARAMEHVDARGGRAWLTTFAGLAPARHLYESFGFELTSEAEGEAWGTRVVEQVFERQ